MALHTLPEDCIHAVLRNCSLCAIGRTGRACTALREAAAARSAAADAPSAEAQSAPAAAPAGAPGLAVATRGAAMAAASAGSCKEGP